MKKINTNKIIIVFLFVFSQGYGLLKAQSMEEERMIYNGNIGINTNAPQANLDVNGNVKLDKLESADNAKLLLVNNKGELVAGEEVFKSTPVSGGNPERVKNQYITALRIKAQMKNPNMVKIKDLDTKIPVNNYEVLLLKGEFIYDGYYKNQGQSTSYGLKPKNDINKSPQGFYRAFKKDGTWHLEADYPVYANSDAEVRKYGSYWDLKVIVVKKGLIKDMGVFEDQLNHIKGGWVK
ncbi:hypothetical protein ACT4R9_04760 [Ornithobacterium rhinotracheale]|uniref:hypothetical protein n=1 Tax=Ornithobacterium rhinotracheale TaxID=28251 RepID=UPI003FA44284